MICCVKSDHQRYYAACDWYFRFFAFLFVFGAALYTSLSMKVVAPGWPGIVYCAMQWCDFLVYFIQIMVRQKRGFNKIAKLEDENPRARGDDIEQSSI